MNPTQILNQLFWLESSNPGELPGIRLQVISPTDNFAGTLFFNLVRCGILFFTEGVEIPEKDLIYAHAEPIYENNVEFKTSKKYIVFDQCANSEKTLYLNPQAYGLEDKNYVLEYIDKLGTIHYSISNFSFDLEKDLIMCTCALAVEPSLVVTHQNEK